MITVKGILHQWLQANGYDGLYNDDCGCSLVDFIPCDGKCDDCLPGVKYPADPATGFDFTIGPKEKGDKTV